MPKEGYLNCFSSGFDTVCILVRVIAHQRWIVAEYCYTRKLFGPNVPWYILKMYSLNANKQSRAAGIGRHLPKEIEDIGHNDLSALSTFIGIIQGYKEVPPV